MNRGKGDITVPEPLECEESGTSELETETLGNVNRDLVIWVYHFFSFLLFSLRARVESYLELRNGKWVREYDVFSYVGKVSVLDPQRTEF